MRPRIHGRSVALGTGEASGTRRQSISRSQVVRASTHPTQLVELAGQSTVLRDRSDVIREVDALSDRYFTYMVNRGVMREIKS